MVLEPGFSHFIDVIDSTTKAEADLVNLRSELDRINSELNKAKLALAKSIKDGGAKFLEMTTDTKEQIQGDLDLLFKQRLGIVNKLELLGYEETLNSIELRSES